MTLPLQKSEQAFMVGNSDEKNILSGETQLLGVICGAAQEAAEKVLLSVK
jgi:hypothetical protein